MAALIELGEFKKREEKKKRKKKSFYLNVLIFDFVVPFFGKLLFWGGFLSTALFSGFAQSSAACLGCDGTRGSGGGGPRLPPLHHH